MKKNILFLALISLFVLCGKNDIVSANQKKQNYEDNVSTQLEVTPKGDTDKNKNNEIRHYKLSDLEPTGIYLKKGDTLTVESDSGNSAYLMLGPYGKYTDLNNGEEVVENVPLEKGTITYKMEHEFGIVYIRNVSTSQKIHVTIKGGRKLPTYKLGTTDEKAFKKELEETTDAPFYEIVGDRVFGTFQSSKTKSLVLANPSLETLVKYWDKLWKLEGETYGLTEEDAYGAMNKFKERAQIINTDVGAGAAYASNNFVNFHIAGGLYKSLLSYTGTEQLWSIWHEIGHVFQSPLLMWGAGTSGSGDLTEVSVNISSLYIQKTLGFSDRILGNANYRKGIKEFLSAPNEGKVFETGENSEVQIDNDTLNWVKLGMFDQLMMAYGNNIYSIFMNQARVQNLVSPNSLPQTNEQKRQYFMKSISTITQRNLKSFFEKWGLHPDNDTINTFNQYQEPSVDITENLLPGNDEAIEDNILPPTETPTGTPKTAQFILGAQPDEYNVSDLLDMSSLKNLPSGDSISPTSQIITTNDLLANSGVKVKLTNQEGQSNIITIPTEKSYGNAISMTAYASEERAIFTLHKKTKTIETYTDEAKTTALTSGTGNYVTFKLMDKNGRVKKELSANRENSPQDFVHALRNIAYEEGDILELTIGDSGKLQSYKEGTVDLNRSDSSKKEYFKIEKDQFTHLSATDLAPTGTAVEPTIKIGEALPEASNFVKNLKDSFGGSNLTVAFKQAPSVNKAGEQTGTITLTDKITGLTTDVAVTVKVLYDNSLALAAYSSTDIRSVLRLDANTHQIVGFANPDRNTALDGNDSKYWEVKLIRNGETIKDVSAKGTDKPFDFTSTLNGLPYQDGDLVYVYAKAKYIENYQSSQLIPDTYAQENYFKIKNDQFIRVDNSAPTITITNDHLIYEKDEALKEADLLKEAGVSTESINTLSTDFSSELSGTLGEHTVTVTATNPVTGETASKPITVTIVTPSFVLNGTLEFTDSDSKLEVGKAKEVHLTVSGQASNSSSAKNLELAHQFGANHLSLGSTLSQKLPGKEWGSQTIDPSQALKLSVDQLGAKENYEAKYDITASEALSIEKGDQWKVTYSYVNEVDGISKTYTKTLDLSLKTETNQSPDPDPDDGGSTSLQKKGTITFREDAQPSYPVDPVDPNQPIIPDQPINPNGAELMITYASDINFGKQSKSETSWHALADSVKNEDDSASSRSVVPFVSIKDSRGTDRKGWKLEVTQDDDFKDSDGNVLKGANLTYSDLNYADQTNSPVATSGEVTLNNNASVIAQADATQGAGNTSLALGILGSNQQTSGVTLSVLPGTMINSKVYTTTVTYELVAGA